MLRDTSRSASTGPSAVEKTFDTFLISIIVLFPRNAENADLPLPKRPGTSAFPHLRFVEA